VISLFIGVAVALGFYHLVKRYGEVVEKDLYLYYVLFLAARLVMEFYL
jgi:hypothetical protein